MNSESQWTAISNLAEWSPWARFSEAAIRAPKLPGVYVFRDPRNEALVYVGMAGERAGSGNAQGLWGRLGVYRIGKGATSGFGETVFDRALNDADFVEGQLERLRAGEVIRAKAWAMDAIEWFSPEVCWAVCASKADALALERQLITLLHGSGLWNRGNGRGRVANEASPIAVDERRL